MLDSVFYVLQLIDNLIPSERVIDLDVFSFFIFVVILFLFWIYVTTKNSWRLLHRYKQFIDVPSTIQLFRMVDFNGADKLLEIAMSKTFKLSFLIRFMTINAGLKLTILASEFLMMYTTAYYEEAGNSGDDTVIIIRDFKHLKEEIAIVTVASLDNEYDTNSIIIATFEAARDGSAEAYQFLVAMAYKECLIADIINLRWLIDARHFASTYEMNTSWMFKAFKKYIKVASK